MELRLKIGFKRDYEATPLPRDRTTRKSKIDRPQVGDIQLQTRCSVRWDAVEAEFSLPSDVSFSADFAAPSRD